ncbi:6057_t:CDS:2 [Dentiscutata erythropus]|uniref:6057_t:CDS:1 n=1 Tax=Dentiscutata erythropus TaxID=1348616 RepID=A0A9N9GF90_9GLOM|nr:6057_t:CDS:2 [Dentiscutata erythropus]
MNIQTTSFSPVKHSLVLLLNKSLNFIDDQYLENLQKVKNYLETNYNYKIINGYILLNLTEQDNKEHLEKLNIATSKFSWIKTYDVSQAHQINKNTQSIKVMYFYESDYILNEEVKNLNIDNLEVEENNRFKELKERVNSKDFQCNTIRHQDLPQFNETDSFVNIDI